MPLEQEYRAPEVCRLAGITYRQLDYWARNGSLKPSIRDSDGSGTSRIYSSDDVKKAQVLAELLGLGIRHPDVERLLADPKGEIQELIDQLEAVQRRYDNSPEKLASV